MVSILCIYLHATVFQSSLFNDRTMRVCADEVQGLLPAGFSIGGVCVALPSVTSQACSQALKSLPQTIWQHPGALLADVQLFS